MNNIENMFSVPSLPGNRGKHLGELERIGELESRSVKTRDADAEFSQTLPRFLPGYEGTENMFYFFSL